MDLVLGLSMTSTTVRWVLIEGQTGEGAPLDRGAVDLPATGADAFDADALIDSVLTETVADSRFHAIGITCTGDTEAAANAVLDALSARGYDNVIAVSDTEAVESLAGGIADMAGYHDVAVCTFDPDVALVAVVSGTELTVDRYDRVGDVEVEQTASVIALDLNDRPLDAIFVLGTDDLDPIMSSLETVAAAPVLTAAEADLALARGAAVSAGRAINGVEIPAAGSRWRPSRTGVVASVFVAAVVTFVVSLSVALGMQLTPDSNEQTQNANATEQQQQKKPSAPASMMKAAPPSPKLAAVPPSVAPETRETLAAAAASVPAPPEAVPAVEPPAAAPVDLPAYTPPAPEYVPPVPAYVPPAPPAYVPPAPPAYIPPAAPPVPAQAPEPPRLRDRVIEKIPLINRFHEPAGGYPG